MGFQLSNNANVTHDSADVDDSAESHQSNTAIDRCAGGMDRDLGRGVEGEYLLLLELAEEEAKARDREAYAHESEAGADPGEKGALFGKVSSGIVVYVRHIWISYVQKAVA